MDPTGLLDYDDSLSQGEQEKLTDRPVSAARQSLPSLPDPIAPHPPANSGSFNISAPPPPPTASERVQNIRILRDLKKEPVNLGSNTSSVNKIPDFHDSSDCRLHRAVLIENMANLSVCSTSFTPSTWVCVSCASGHTLLPKRRNLGQWTGGRKVVFLTDQCFPPILPSEDSKCPIIIRREGGTLNEIGDVLCSLLGEHALPEGSLIVLSSLSQLQAEGLQSYIEATIRECNRFNGMFRGTVSVLPILPIPITGLPEASTIRRLADLGEWFNACPGYGMAEFSSAMISHVVHTEGPCSTFGPLSIKLPVNLSSYGSAIWELPGSDQLPVSLPPMTVEEECSIITALLSDLCQKFKLELDLNPTLSRELTLPSAAAVNRDRSDRILVIGGSNADRLANALASLGMDPELLTSGGWHVTTDSVTAIIPEVESSVKSLPQTAPVVIYGLDNGCFMEADQDGIQTTIKKLEDGAYHVVGELTIAPEGRMAAAVNNLRRLVACCGDRDVFIVTPLMRYINESCCNLASHCTHRGIPDYSLKLACDLFRLKNFVHKRLEDLPRCKVVSAGDLLVGGAGVAPSDIVAATTDWRAVHGPASSYARMALNFLDCLKDRNNQPGVEAGRKRPRSDSLSSTASSTSASGPVRVRTNTGSGSIISISSAQGSSRGGRGFSRPPSHYGRATRGRGGRHGGRWNGGRGGR